MSDLDSQRDYWDAVAARKTFTHPLHVPWLDGVGRDAAVLDYGCGYGRTMEALQQEGFGRLLGVDTSAGMIARARELHPAMTFEVPAAPAVSCADGSVDVAVLFAVLTCIPGDQAQHALIAELHRVLRPGGLLYVSDLLLQDDDRSRARYDRFAERYGTYGVFETSDGAVCRHHDSDWFGALLAGFATVGTRHITVNTMNGNQAAGVQILARKPGA